MLMDALRGKKVLVTGGSRGIGAACVRMLSDMGCIVGFTYLGSEKEALEVKEDADGDVFVYRADASDHDAMKRTVTEFSRTGEHGFQGLVINAGIYLRKSITQMSIEDWRRTMATNLDGGFIAVREALPFMKDGSIVMISSQLAFKGSNLGSDYAASKAGLLGFARSLARELAPEIRVNTISPGYIDTDILAGDSDHKRRSRIEQVPLGRIGTPEDVAAVVAFLLSDQSRYITGSNIDVNGGLYIH
ncbi:MAG: SDR family NAD(P)-dependent oxidoreductase [Thermoplasmatota archaeon]